MTLRIYSLQKSLQKKWILQKKRILLLQYK
jgi:hypothetical protein